MVMVVGLGAEATEYAQDEAEKKENQECGKMNCNYHHDLQPTVVDLLIMVADDRPGRYGNHYLSPNKLDTVLL